MLAELPRLMPGGCCSCAQALLHSSHLYSEVKNHAANYGVSVEGVHMDVGKMMAQKDKAVVGLTKGIEGLFKKNKVRRSTSMPQAHPPCLWQRSFMLPAHYIRHLTSTPAHGPSPMHKPCKVSMSPQIPITPGQC